jgi:hypothetical protein
MSTLHNLEDYSFDALCGKNVGAKINTLAYLIGLVDSYRHPAGDPDTARYNILNPLSEAEVNVGKATDILKMQVEFLPINYLPLTPVMFVRKWSPVSFMLQKGFLPQVLNRKTENAPHAVATGIWKPGTPVRARGIGDCTSDEELFWTLINEAFARAIDQGRLVNIIAEVGWKYESQVGRLQPLSDTEISKAGRILWKSTIDG